PPSWTISQIGRYRNAGGAGAGTTSGQRLTAEGTAHRASPARGSRRGRWALAVDRRCAGRRVAAARRRRLVLAGPAGVSRAGGAGGVAQRGQRSGRGAAGDRLRHGTAPG